MTSLVLAAVLLGFSSAAPDPLGADLVRLRGTDFAGGGNALFGPEHAGVWGVNYVYARSTGDHASMMASFTASNDDGANQVLHLYGRDDDGEGNCPIRIVLNDVEVFEGRNEHPSDTFGWVAYPLPPNALQAGQNTLRVENGSAEGPLGGPPWFIVARAVIAPEGVPPALPPRFEENVRIRLPEEKRPIPEPLAEGVTHGFPLRGTKGWIWSPEQYLAEVPYLADLKMNFLMICYGSMCDIEHYPWGDPECNRWWEPLPEAKRKAYEKVLSACQARGIELCLSMNPNLSSSRALDYDSDADFEALWQHYTWMQTRGMRWFCLSLDDITRGIDASGQARLANRLLEHLRAADPKAELIFCPSFYWGDGSGEDETTYLTTLKAALHPDAFVFWTGDAVVGRITCRAAAAYRARVGHRIIIWDNYPVNDAHPTLHLGPVTGRDPRLPEICHGYMGNPLHSENELNRIPLATCADFAYNPTAYDPARSIGQAILWQADTPEQRAVLRDLVSLYPGMLVYGKGTNFNPVVHQMNAILGLPQSAHLAEVYLAHVMDVAARLEAAFPDRYVAGRATLAKSIALLESMVAAE